MLVFSALTPHPPVLIPSIGKDQSETLKKTNESLAELERDLYGAKPDIVIVISPHGEFTADAFTVNISQKFETDFKQFGDFATKLEFLGDTTLLSSDNKEKINEKFALNVISEPILDHGVAVPLFFLCRHLEKIKILPVYFSLLDNKSHLDFGKTFKDIIMDSDKRVAVIASGDLSHCLTKNAPAPYQPEGKKFDEKIIDLLKQKDIQSIVNIDKILTEKATECGLRSLLILLGILHNIKYTPEILSYEAPFGVGYLTVNFKLE